MPDLCQSETSSGSFVLWNVQLEWRWIIQKCPLFTCHKQFFKDLMVQALACVFHFTWPRQFVFANGSYFCFHALWKSQIWRWKISISARQFNKNNVQWKFSVTVVWLKNSFNKILWRTNLSTLTWQRCKSFRCQSFLSYTMKEGN